MSIEEYYDFFEKYNRFASQDKNVIKKLERKTEKVFNSWRNFSSKTKDKGFVLGTYR